MRNTLQNNCTVLFESVKVMKNKEGLRKCQRLEESEGAWQLHAMWDSVLPWTRKKNLRKIGNI